MMTLGRDLLVVTLLLILTKYTVSSHKESGIQRYCGRNLVNVLTMVCDGIYNQMALKEGLELLAKNDPSLRSELPLYREKRDVVSIFKGQTRQRVKRGAYEECCRKGCTVEELIGYCGQTSPTTG